VIERRRGRGDGSVFQRAQDGLWVGQIDLGWVGGKRKRKTVTAKTRKDVLAKMRAARREVESGVVTGEATVEQWLRKWLDDIAPQKVRERTLQGYRGYVDHWLIPELGRVRLDKLQPDHVRMLHQRMAEAGLADATRRQAHMILRRALVVAEREGKILRNPAALVDPPPVGKGHHGYHDAEETRAVIRAALATGDLQHTARIMLAYCAGLRQGEALGLDWRDVDLDVGVVFVHQALARIKGKGLQLGPVKSDASRRFVPLIAPLVETLRALRAQTGGVGLVFGGAGPTDPRRDWQEWKDALKAAGVKDIPLHGARASCASLLRDMGFSERVIADILGHAQVSTTQAHYIRSNDVQRRDALEQAGRRLLEGA
jgi:integrase